MSDTALTLRFKNENTFRALQETAKALGLSVNELAEAAIEKELELIGPELEHRLARIAELLPSYHGQGIEQDIEAFAHGEVSIEDPLRARLAEAEDLHGIGAAFARRVERG
jgi:predicted transcriptional regulator